MRTPFESPSPTFQLDVVWQPSVVLWMMFITEAVAVILTLALGVERPFRHLGAISLATQGILLATLGQLFFLRRFLGTVAPLWTGNLVLVLLLVNAFLLAAITRFTFQPIVGMAPDAWVGLLLRLVGIVLVIGLLGLAAFQNHWRGRLHAVRAKQSELQALQARIRPHFLFNTLNTGAALVHERPEEAERLLLDLADLFRAALGGPRQIPLADELSLARRYLEIEALRFGERLTVHWHLPRELPAVTVPALSIQPLVENAVRHGVERLPHGDVDMRVTTTPERVIVRISNPLPPPDGTASTGHQVGLNASQVRIEAMTDGRGSVQTQVENGRFIATVRLPIAP